MKLTIAIAAFNQLADTKSVWGCLIANTVDKQNVELLVINNGSTDGTGDFLERFVLPHFPDHKIITQENVGVIKSLDQMHRTSSGDVVAVLHNDVHILEYGWNKRVMAEFENDPKLGLAGFFGAEGLHPDGGRINCYSNLLEAEIHGIRTNEVREVLSFDGLSLIARRKMLDETGGFDQEYTYHHAYDRDISLQSHQAGWTNKLIPIYCDHRSGVTVNRPQYQKWISEKLEVEEGKGDVTSYTRSMNRFENKWRHYLPRMHYQR